MRLQAPIVGRDALASAHKGLLLDKYLPLKAAQKEGEHVDRLKAIARIPSNTAVYKLAFERWKRVTEGMATASGKVRGRMAIGLGAESTMEIGCRLHTTYGTPLIPGSSVKGALRAHLETDARYREAAGFLFGSTAQEGYAEVYDAWWEPVGNGSGLALDVITVHHQNYYSGKGSPADNEAPVPVQFLTVTGRFYFAIRTPGASWDEFVKGALRDLLEKRGIGAKRAAGYGRFVFG